MRRLGSIVLTLAAAAAGGCAAVGPRGLTAEAPVPAGPAVAVELAAPPAPEPSPPALPESLFAAGAALTLADVVAIALENNPLTRASYHQALAAAAQLESKRAAYYPSLDLSANVTRQQQSAFGGQFDVLQTSWGPTVNLEYLVLDLGGRAANAEDARLALLAADWTHNATIQAVILEVQRTFVDYLNAKGQLAAARDAVAEAKAALDAANVRHDAGVATIADVLQARTASSQAQLAVDGLSGEVLALRGALATAMGLPATTPYDVGDLPAELPLAFATETVETLISRARTARPDLAAARLQAEKATTHVRAVRADGLPKLSAAASAGRSYFRPSTFADYGDSWSGRLLLTVPLFTGFESRANIAKAVEEAAAAAAQAETLEQQVVLQVWSSYYALQTAGQLVETSHDLLASAAQSEKVALGRYQEGVGTIIDLLAAQAALSDARAQEIAARSTWYLALAQLAHDTGVASPALAAVVTVTEEKRNP